MKEGEFTAILLDLSLPDSSGLQTVLKMRYCAPSVPIVVLTGWDDQALALKSMQAGVQDYLVKGEVDADSLAQSLLYAIERNRVQSRFMHRAEQLQLANQRLKVLAETDPLTGLLNRRGLEQILDGLLGDGEIRLPLVAVLVDLDNFKEVNEAHGHAVGDLALKEAARRIHACLRPGDCAARVGGDEFLLLAPRECLSEGVDFGEILRSNLSRAALPLDRRGVRLTASLGLALVPSAARSIEDLLTLLHPMLAQSKGAGKDRLSYR